MMHSQMLCANDWSNFCIISDSSSVLEIKKSDTRIPPRARNTIPTPFVSQILQSLFHRFQLSLQESVPLDIIGKSTIQIL